MEHDDVICLDPSNGSYIDIPFYAWKPEISGTAEDPITLSDDEEHHVEMKAFMVGRELAQRAGELHKGFWSFRVLSFRATEGRGSSSRYDYGGVDKDW